MNHITISGRLTRDPEARVSANGKSVTNFALAVDRPFTKDTTDFFDVVTFGKLAEICGNNLDKGYCGWRCHDEPLYCQGRKQTQPL